MNLRRFAIAVGIAACISMAGRASAQLAATTAFTFQGLLQSGGSDAAGSYDFQFKLFNAVTGGTQVGTTQTASGVAVAAGRFSVNLDFGGVYNSSRLWIDIGVRAAGGGAFMPLTPRQELTGAPYAQGLVLPLLETSPNGTPLYIASTAANGTGIYGVCNNGVQAYGLWGASASGYGVVGTGSSGATGGLFGSDSGTGLLVRRTSSVGAGPALEADSNSTADGAIAIRGQILNAGIGAAAVMGVVQSTSSGYGIGVLGSGTGPGEGVLGSSDGGVGVIGQGSTFGVFGSGNTGVEGLSSSTAPYTGVLGESEFGGSASFGLHGISSTAGGNAVLGEATSGPNSYGVWGKCLVANGYAGYFNGNVNIVGNITKSGGAFRIDHPLDPANKYLQHSFVESPDMKNIYDGVITTDGRGYATVQLPDWFGALNGDFRYQLTAIDEADSDEFVQAKVVHGVKNNQFTIRSSSPNITISWQVTGIRQDPWAKAHPIVTELEKTGAERGHVLIPEAYGMPESASMDHIKELAPTPAAPPARFVPVGAAAPAPAPTIAQKSARP